MGGLEKVVKRKEIGSKNKKRSFKDKKCFVNRI